MIRKAVPSDIPVIVSLSLEASKNQLLLASKERAFKVVRECISTATHFAWVTETDGVIDGMLLALVHPNILHERSCATVFLCKDDEHLISKFLDWARNRPVIKRIVFHLEQTPDPEFGKLLNRLGLETIPIYMETR